MRRALAFCSVLVLALLGFGCKSDEEAREYAQKLIDILKSYQAQLEAKAGAEQEAYKQLARIYRSSAESDLLAALDAERRERGDELAEQEIAGKAPAGAALKDRLKRYADLDVDRTRDVLFRASDERDKYLSSLHEISVEADAVEALIKALEALTQKSSLGERIRFYRDYASAAKSCLDELVCSNLDAELEAVKKQLAANGLSEEELAALKAKQQAIETRRKSAGCPIKPDHGCVTEPGRGGTG